ncbi:hypothetical protein HYH03_003879 [Edaphochlamys debaryana]|uniref:Uncharacterized protein n=1 Tax=Edaphochlamys debaryana TaxID=47281 RepID=A0A835Y8T2_9CHLO|nr:hypothetical protein HYH03_003879 [Edaphochlamys debaryana]|eukprot:KAG2498121.1 hypothetical protein HYH03_003879 [Edaphochlamys debaryana]
MYTSGHVEILSDAVAALSTEELNASAQDMKQLLAGLAYPDFPCGQVQVHGDEVSDDMKTCSLARLVLTMFMDKLSMGYQSHRTSPSTSGVGVGAHDNARYIYGSTTALPEGRYGSLPPALHEVFNAGYTCEGGTPTHLTNRTTCVLRRGFQPGSSNLLNCLAKLLNAGVSGRQLPELIRRNLDPATFISLHHGELAHRFVPRRVDAHLRNAVEVQSFCAWFLKQPAAYVERFQLQDVIDVIRSGAFAAGAARGSTRATGVVAPALLKATREFVLFIALQAFVDALQAERSHELLLDLVNVAPKWLNPSRVQVLVLSKSRLPGDFVMSCPVRSAAPVGGALRAAFLVQHGGHYEALCTVVGVRGGVAEEFHLDVQHSPGVRALMGAASDACAALADVPASSRAASVARALRHTGQDVEYQLLDYSLQCAGFITRAGTLVPLARPDGLVLALPDVRVAYIDAAMDLVDNDARPIKVRHASAVFERLAKALADSAYEVVRAVQLSSGSRSLLLRMGKLVPLSVDDDVTTPHHAPGRDFLRAAHADGTLYRNVLAVLALRCPLPWDVRHLYIAHVVGRAVPKDASLGPALADRLLLGVRRPGRPIPEPDVDVLDIDGDGLDAAQLGQLLLSEGSAGRPCADDERVDAPVRVSPDLPPELAGNAADALSGNAKSSRGRIMSKASTRAKALLRTRSAHSRTSTSSGSRRNRRRLHIISVPMTHALAVDVMHPANALLHPVAPVDRAALAAVAGGSLFDSIRAMSNFLEVPLVVYAPTEHRFSPLEGSPQGDLAVIVAVRGADDCDVILTRVHAHHEPRMFGMLTSLEDLTDPATTIGAP